MVHQAPQGPTVAGVERSSGWSSEDPQTMIRWTLIQANHAVVRRVSETLATIGLTPTQLGVLVQLMVGPGASQAELARRVLVTPQTLGELLPSLERLDYVRRTPGRPGTATSVAITPEGSAAPARAIPLLGALDAPESLGLTAVEAAELSALLHEVINASSPDLPG
jgi:DNA-binding MarR family transcriptional regulator